MVYAVLDLSELEKNGVSEVRKEQIKRLQIRETTDKYHAILLGLADGKDRRSGRRTRRGWPPSSPRCRAATPTSPPPPSGSARRPACATASAKRSTARATTCPTSKGSSSERNLPVDLSRLPFVESLFQWQARSNVAAGGIWQFMPGTGRLFGLRSQAEYDERYDPLRATSAAARLLADNFAALGAWPLAITAYNHGQGGVRRAVRVTGSTDMGVIASTYTGRAFGFASRNFYAEFLAAAKIYRNREHHFPGLAAAAPIAFEEFRPAQFVKVGELAKKAELDLDVLRELNPAAVEGGLGEPAAAAQGLCLEGAARQGGGAADRVRRAAGRIQVGKPGRRPPRRPQGRHPRQDRRPLRHHGRRAARAPTASPAPTSCGSARS